MLDAISKSLPYYYLTSAIVLVGAISGPYFIPLGKHYEARETDLIGSLAAWDGRHYVEIAKDGYSYDPDKMSNVAFFPAFPLAGRWLAALTGWRTDYALVCVAHLFLLAAFIVLALYAQQRGAPIGAVLLAFGLFPTTFYFRMAYTESLFFFLVCLFLLGMEKRWPTWLLALVVGLATATRVAGIALWLPLGWHLGERSPTPKKFLAQAALLLPLAGWGLAAYMVFQYLALGDPLAFMKTQRHWDQRPPLPWPEKLWLEVTLEPFWCEYVPGCHCYQIHAGRDLHPLLSMDNANPLFFLLFAGLTVLGSAKGWLTRREALTAAALLLFSYLTKSYATCMSSQARYAATTVPVFVVMGQGLCRLPRPLAALFLAGCVFFLAIYAALFVRWHNLY